MCRLRQENKPRAVSMISKRIWEFGAATLAFLFVTGVLTLEANLSKPVRLNDKLLFTALGILGAYYVYWYIKFFRAFKVPGEIDHADKVGPGG